MRSRMLTRAAQDVWAAREGLGTEMCRELQVQVPAGIKIVNCQLLRMFIPTELQARACRCAIPRACPCWSYGCPNAGGDPDDDGRRAGARGGALAARAGTHACVRARLQGITTAQYAQQSAVITAETARELAHVDADILVVGAIATSSVTTINAAAVKTSAVSTVQLEIQALKYIQRCAAGALWARALLAPPPPRRCCGAAARLL